MKLRIWVRLWEDKSIYTKINLDLLTRCSSLQLATVTYHEITSDCGKRK